MNLPQNNSASQEDNGIEEVILTENEKMQEDVQGEKDPELGQSNDNPQQQQEQQQQQYPGAYAVRGINSVQATNQKDPFQAANCDVGNLEDNCMDNLMETTLASSNTETTNTSATDTASNTADTTGIVGNHTSSIATAADSSMGASTGGGSGTANSGTANSGTTSTTQPSSEFTARTELLLTASVVHPTDESLDRERLIAETEARVRREISGSGEFPPISALPIVEAEMVAPYEEKGPQEKRRNRNLVAVFLAAIVVVIAIVVTVVLVTTRSRSDATTINTSTSESYDKNATIATVAPTEAFINTSTSESYDKNAANATVAPTEALLGPEESNGCVTKKFQDWLDMDTPLQEQLDRLMDTVTGRLVVETCQAEIQVINEATERSCQLEVEHDSPWNYGDLWMSWNNQMFLDQNMGSENGAVYLDGYYLTALILYYTWYFTIPFPTPYCLADCYTKGKCKDAHNNTSDVAAHNMPISQSELNGGLVSPEMYCQVEWATIDQAYIDLKLCAADAANARFDLALEYYSKELYKADFDLEKIENEKCSEKYCTT